MSRPIAKLALEDGTVYSGFHAGAPGTTTGEIVFNTSMTGYQEILTDPSYKGQIVTMTYPLIGNYGINTEDLESRTPQVAGFVVRELVRNYSNWRASMSLDDYLLRAGVVAIEGIDTRSLTRKIRSSGAMRSVLSSELLDDTKLIAVARGAADMNGADWVQSVKPDKPYNWSEPLGDWSRDAIDPKSGAKLHVVAIDCGAKHNILRHFAQRGVRVTVVPPATSVDDILKLKPDGLFLSNGPGDPQALDYAIEPVRDMIQKLRKGEGGIPIFGICLGHQLLGRALGADTFKLKFGHRGGNQPVKNLDTGRVEITSQNHGFAVDRHSLERAGGVVTHLNLNDNTVEGFRHDSLPIFSVQYHPEASPGPHDADYLFDRFVDLMHAKR